MLGLSIKTNFRDWARNVEAYEKQVAFATAVALTDTARLDCKPAAERLLERRLDKPTPFTKRGIGTQGARKSRLIASVFVKDRQAEYLRWQQSGGVRKPRRRAIPIAVNERRNQYGNLPKGRIQKLLARPDTFSGTINGVAGIWQRPKRGKRRAGGSGTKGKVRSIKGVGRTGLKLLVRYEEAASYRPRLGYQQELERVAKRAFPMRFNAAWERAAKTARVSRR